jgi:hypothetical protein
MSLDLDLDQFHDHLNGTSIGVDDGDSQDVDMSGNMRNNGQNQAEKRAHHNALERKRRDHIKGSFGDLRDVIPSLKGEKVKDYKNESKNKIEFFQGFACSCS